MWTIIKEFGGGKKTGVSSCNFDESNASALVYRFRLSDDDSEVYYEGLSDDCDSEAFDDFGQGNAGCTEIHYFAQRVWRQL